MAPAEKTAINSGNALALFERLRGYPRLVCGVIRTDL
jgi:hypothetical protein